MQKQRFPKYSVAWDILFLVLAGLLLVLFATGNYRIPDPHFAIGLMLGLCALVCTFRTRKPHIIYWGLQIFIWCLGLGMCFTAEVLYSGSWQEIFLSWLLLPVIVSAVLAILYKHALSLLNFILFKTDPKSDLHFEDSYTSYSENSNHVPIQEVQEMKIHHHYD
jgi:lysylphosphatidylglycerol synthetase-like protein (DUF2156 family)